MFNSVLYLLAAFILGVIFGLFVKTITKILFSIVLAVFVLILLSSLFDKETLSSIIATIIGVAMLIFTFLINKINSIPRVHK